MTPTLAALLLVALQTQPPVAALDQRFAGQPSRPSRTSPASGDTVGYWQQRADYQIVATLDEAMGGVHARGVLTYTNQSPDTLRELFVHQHLNAFRPASQWSATDDREGRVRFQWLRDPAYAYERFTAVPTFDGVAVSPTYPGAPDSTVARFVLPRPLPPGASTRVTFEWDARLSTTLRRQGRRERSFDFAQWYPKVAVYDRGGWQPHALVPSGEFYGEFGTFDVTLVLPEDQVIGSTGIPVEGDPGWTRASRSGEVRIRRDAYGSLPPAPEASVPAGFKRVRWFARDVHHFGWSTSPDYRYEGGAYVRDRSTTNGPARARIARWDTVGVHALYRPGDDSTWGRGQVVARTVATLGWLERVYGPYGYPQMTVLHRLEGGGTEFPMMQMNGSPSQGLNLHEGGHIYSYGLLANNEWQSGWMDEGLTSYQTAWATGDTRADHAAGSAPFIGAAPGDSVRRRMRDALDSTSAQQARMVTSGRMQPIGTRGDAFTSSAVYNAAVYTRASLMYGALRDVLGDSAFAAFLRDYYARWAYRHVDEAAMRASAERAHGRDLGWFFEQWVHRTGNVDYALRDVRTVRDGRGWVTRATLVRTGAYRHPMPVGVRTAAGWTIVRGDPMRDREQVVIRSTARPETVALDPLRTTEATEARHYRFPGAGEPTFPR
jgi:hypothetical protein